MTDDNPEKPPVDPGEQPDEPGYRDWREEREERRAQRRSGGGAWWGGLVLIVLGVIFLLQNMGAAIFSNWWALFILIPAVAAFGAAWRSYQAAGNRLTAPARGSLIGGLVLTAISLGFLFNLNGRLFWPMLIILAGVGIALNAMLPA
jgi:hypothetical protein